MSGKLRERLCGRRQPAEKAQGRGVAQPGGAGGGEAAEERQGAELTAAGERRRRG